ncbi:hypothetical protein F3Y22_tig00112047pilonHSYRG00009 [Hibiscus syriacus]|uniref:RNase H type-1 domain-containing protein n=1 Tax=Hibiscus syriacus TaxID=106335 RepID=A0A6A2YE51_HIBSY|nr:hypothetical protein F3Y22_tig00112047pilonHSYRG00009 [Hibiscus syriacus]
MQAWNQGERRVILEMDSVEALQIIQRKKHCSVSFSLTDRIFAFLNRDWNVQFRHTPRATNKVADKLTKMADFGGTSIRMYFDPSVLVLSLLQEEENATGLMTRD